MNFNDIATTPVKLDENFFFKLPKTDIHVHLDGSLRPSTILELAEKQGIDIGASTIEELKNKIGAGKIHNSLNEYLKGFEITLKVLQTQDSLYRTAYELAIDAAAENVRYMEIRYSPILHTQNNLSLASIVEAVIDGLETAQKETGIQSGIILCGIRNISPQVSLRLAELAVAFKNKGVVGFDLAGAEYNNPAKLHLEAFSIILSNNVNVTIHAGEAYGPNSIHQALHYCGAHRIGHGTRLIENGDLLNYVNDLRIPLEICLSSNLQTKAVEKIENHPFKFYYDLGLRISLNTDNRLITDTTMTNEYLLAYNHFNLLPKDILNLAIHSIKSCFIPYERKRRFIRQIKAEIKELFVKQAIANSELAKNTPDTLR